MKTLYLSETNKKLAGVLGGLGETYDIDPTLLRVLTVLLAILTGLFPVVVAYIFAWLLTPHKPEMAVSEPTIE